ncbi:MAG: metal-sensing transcriptional repressor [Clostridiales bacterium]|nr:metal-sensing transcriptional repressor [Clostridiales bacterium]
MAEEQYYNEAGEACCDCSTRSKERSEKERKELINRLNRIEGQIRGIKGMLERDAYCTDIITQVIAANSALDSFNRLLLANHIRTCVVDDIKDDKEDSVDELIALLHKLMR